MSGDGAEFRMLATDLGFWMVIFGVLLAFIRLARGPSLPDRVVALDMMTILIVGFCGLFAVYSGDPAFLDVAIVLALIGFLATVALARFAERRMIRSDEAAAEEAAEEDATPGDAVPAEAAGVGPRGEGRPAGLPAGTTRGGGA